MALPTTRNRPAAPSETTVGEEGATLRIRTGSGDGVPAAGVLADRQTVPSSVPAPASHQLPAHRGKVGRITDHLTGLSDDVREWVELRVRLARAEIEALIDTRVVALRGQLVFGAVAGIAALYFLVTLAVVVGAVFGGRYWIGFLSVNVLLAGAAWWAKRKFAPGKLRVERSKATGTLKISHDQTPAQKEAETKGEPIPEGGKLKA